MWNEWDGRHMDGGWSFVMVLGMVGIWALVAVAVVWMVGAMRSARAAGGAASAGGPSAPHRSPTAGAEEILAERLARGDIDAEEYSARLGALTSRRPS